MFLQSNTKWSVTIYTTHQRNKYLLPFYIFRIITLDTILGLLSRVKWHRFWKPEEIIFLEAYLVPYWYQKIISSFGGPVPQRRSLTPSLRYSEGVRCIQAPSQRQGVVVETIARWNQSVSESAQMKYEKNILPVSQTGSQLLNLRNYRTHNATKQSYVTTQHYF